MKRTACIAIFLIGFIFAFGSSVSAATSIGGVWKGSVMKASYTACSTVPITLTLIQCAGSNVLRGTALIGTISLSVVGRVQADGVTVYINGAKGAPVHDVELTLHGTYIPGAPAKIQVTDIDVLLYNSTAYSYSNDLYDTFYLTKQ